MSLPITGSDPHHGVHSRVPGLQLFYPRTFTDDCSHGLERTACDSSGFANVSLFELSDHLPPCSPLIRVCKIVISDTDEATDTQVGLEKLVSSPRVPPAGEEPLLPTPADPTRGPVLLPWVSLTPQFCGWSVCFCMVFSFPSAFPPS